MWQRGIITALKKTGIDMKIQLAILVMALSLSACDRPTTTVVAVPGPAGPQGETGDQGNKGATGYTGQQGESGMQGNKGNTGYTGAQGNTGVQVRRVIHGQRVTRVKQATIPSSLFLPQKKRNAFNSISILQLF